VEGKEKMGALPPELWRRGLQSPDKKNLEAKGGRTKKTNTLSFWKEKRRTRRAERGWRGSRRRETKGGGGGALSFDALNRKKKHPPQNSFVSLLSI
jgi:hypothetical protein